MKGFQKRDQKVHSNVQFHFLSCVLTFICKERALVRVSLCSIQRKLISAVVYTQAHNPKGWTSTGSSLLHNTVRFTTAQSWFKVIAALVSQNSECTFMQGMHWWHWCISVWKVESKANHQSYICRCKSAQQKSICHKGTVLENSHRNRQPICVASKLKFTNFKTTKAVYFGHLCVLCTSSYQQLHWT